MIRLSIDTRDANAAVAFNMWWASQKCAFLCRTRRKCEPANTRASSPGREKRLCGRNAR